MMMEIVYFDSVLINHFHVCYVGTALRLMLSLSEDLLAHYVAGWRGDLAPSRPYRSSLVCFMQHLVRGVETVSCPYMAGSSLKNVFPINLL